MPAQRTLLTALQWYAWLTSHALIDASALFQTPHDASIAAEQAPPPAPGMKRARAAPPASPCTQLPWQCTPNAHGSLLPHALQVWASWVLARVGVDDADGCTQPMQRGLHDSAHAPSRSWLQSLALDAHAVSVCALVARLLRSLRLASTALLDGRGGAHPDATSVDTLPGGSSTLCESALALLRSKVVLACYHVWLSCAWHSAVAATERPYSTHASFNGAEHREQASLMCANDSAEASLLLPILSDVQEAVVTSLCPCTSQLACQACAPLSNQSGDSAPHAAWSPWQTQLLEEVRFFASHAATSLLMTQQLAAAWQCATRKELRLASAHPYDLQTQFRFTISAVHALLQAEVLDAFLLHRNSATDHGDDDSNDTQLGEMIEPLPHRARHAVSDREEEGASHASPSAPRLAFIPSPSLPKLLLRLARAVLQLRSSAQTHLASLCAGLTAAVHDAGFTDPAYAACSASCTWIALQAAQLALALGWGTSPDAVVLQVEAFVGDEPRERGDESLLPSAVAERTVVVHLLWKHARPSLLRVWMQPLLLTECLPDGTTLHSGIAAGMPRVCRAALVALLDNATRPGGMCVDAPQVPHLELGDANALHTVAARVRRSWELLAAIVQHAPVGAGTHALQVELQVSAVLQALAHVLASVPTFTTSVLWQCMQLAQLVSGQLTQLLLSVAAGSNPALAEVATRIRRALVHGFQERVLAPIFEACQHLFAGLF
ncbi:hypothetical protein EON66_04565 [archaeon]|nr:MAG: hypothetical protein EON66_04565 [archaeon]